MTSGPAEGRSPLLKLGVDSHTLQRLQHASPEHLHLTTRRCFIGPIPQGWLNSHRREWYRHHLGIHYSSRAATFTAAPDVGRHRRLTGLEGPSVSATYHASFPQPTDLAADEDDVRDDDDDDDGRSPDARADQHGEAPPDAPASTTAPPAIFIPRAEYQEDDEDDDLAPAEPVPTHDPSLPSPDPLDPLTASASSQDTIKPSPQQSRKTTSRSTDTPSSLTPDFLSAPTSRSRSSGSPSASRPRPSRSASGGSFVTANEDVSETPRRLSTVTETDSRFGSPNALSAQISDTGDLTIGAPSSRQDSFRSLLPRDQRDGPTDAVHIPDPSPAETQSSPAAQQSAVDHPESASVTAEEIAEAQIGRAQPGLVRFNIPEDEQQKRQLVNVRLAQMRKRDTFKQLRRGKVHDGQIVKMEKVLARVDFTVHEVPPNFTENLSEKIETTAIEKWKEFMCVCRENDDDDAPFVLQFYRSRVIPALEKTRVKKRWTYEVQLRRSNCKVNLFSSLDKTMVLWHPSRRGTKLFTLMARSGANSMEWYTFLRNTLGGSRTTTLQIAVPDLAVKLKIDKPFENLESTESVAQAAEGNEEAIVRTIKEEQAAVVHIIHRCLQMLDKSPEWDSVMSTWNGAERMGLAWKRYDRLEWIHGANERKMYGTIGMDHSHELELRPKQHYPTSMTETAGSEPLTEPPPVEGFLIRLTSQRGASQKLGRLFFKRLYFSTHNQFLVFCRPAKADPPPPPKMPMTEQEEIPSSEQIADKSPLVYSVNPFPLKADKTLQWLAEGATGTYAEHDRDAMDENERKTRNVLNCDGVLNLCNVREIRNVQRGATPADERVDEGSNVDFDVHVADSTRDDGTTGDMDDDRVFELVLANELVVRLQAFSKATKDEWVSRLEALLRYWKLRVAADAALYKEVRARNMASLRLDEQTESYVGQYAQKWEVTGSFASPELYNMCGISCCRTIHMSGMLFRKARMHGAFQRYLTLLAHGKLLLFADAVRGRDGALVRHIQHERVATLDLRDCYVYSGLLTANNLLYQSDAHGGGGERRGRHALPRMYPGDGWSSTDEDTATTFVVWHGKRTSWFKSQGVEQGGRGRQRLKKVRTLGAEGRSVVFKTRSRAERDHWVMSIGMEIERFWAGDDVRIDDGGAGDLQAS